jgi:hypothetical protein
MRQTFGQKIIGAALAALVFGAFAQPAGAIEISKHAKDTAEVNAIQLKGHIDEGDTFDLQAFIAGLPKKAHVVVFLNSPGGNLAEGMRLGRFFFTHKIETVIESKTACASACALAFLGGRDEATGKARRTKASNSGLGFHSFTRDFDKDKSYTADDLKIVVQRTQSTVYVVADYLKSIGTDLDVIRLMLKAQANEMNFLTNDDALALNIRVFDEKRNQVVDPEQVMDRLSHARSLAGRPAPSTTAKAEGKSPT